LFVYFLIKVLIKTDKPDYWGVIAIQKDKTLSMCARYSIGKPLKENTSKPNWKPIGNHFQKLGCKMDSKINKLRFLKLKQRFENDTLPVSNI